MLFTFSSQQLVGLSPSAPYGPAATDFSSVFDTIFPHKLVGKLMDLGLQHSTCTWIWSFLSGRSQRMRICPQTSTALSLSTGFPQGCVLSPLLYTLYIHDCTSIHHSNTTAYIEETEWLTVLCRENNLLLNTSKTKQVIINFRRKKTDILPLYIHGDGVERVVDFRFLGVHHEEDLTWGMNTSELLAAETAVPDGSEEKQNLPDCWCPFIGAPLRAS